MASSVKTWAVQLCRSMNTVDLDRKAFAEALDRHLQDRSASEFAESANVSPQYVSDLRKGRRVPSRCFLEKVIRATARQL